MRIAIILAISVIFASGAYTAFAEEPIPELIFEGGTYEIYKGNQILVPIKIQVENHDHTIVPVITTIYENQVIKTSYFAPSHSGTFHTFLIINDNWKTGQYYLQLRYDDIILNPILFTITRDHIGVIEERQSKTIADYGNLLSKESSMKLGSNNIEVDFSYPYSLDISGHFAEAGDKGVIRLNIDGPQSAKLITQHNNLGDFFSTVLIDYDWPSGQYTITSSGKNKIFASETFTVNNLNQEKIDEKITGTIELDSTTSDDFDVLLIKGSLQGSILPETLAIKIFKDDEPIDMIITNLQFGGMIDTSLVLYDYSSRSSWESGNYRVEFVESGESHESYSIMSNFLINDKGKAIIDLEEGAKILEEYSEKYLLPGEIFETDDSVLHEITIFGQVADYVKAKRNLSNFEARPIDISIVGYDGEAKKFSIFPKKTGTYEMPLVIDDTWNSGKYDVYVTYSDTTRNTASFIINEELEVEVQSTEPEVKTVNTIVPKQLDLFFNNTNKTEIVNFNFSDDSVMINSQKVEVILEKPDGSIEEFYLNVNDEGGFDMPMIIENSWGEGEYTLSFVNDDITNKFAMFTVTNDITTYETFILNQHLDTANPDKIYPLSNHINIENNEIFLNTNDNTHLQLSGELSNYSTGNIIIEIHRAGKIVSESKINPASSGKFNDILKIDSISETGFFEVSAKYADNEFAVSEFLIVEPNIITAQFGPKPIQISRDMFIESGGLIILKLTGPINDYKFADSGMINFTILKPNGMIEESETEIKKWGYFTHEIPVTTKWQDGTYIISAQLGEKKAGHIYLQILDFDIQWIKDITHEWIDGEISTYQYANRFDTAIENNAVDSESIVGKIIPEWFKNTAKLWVDDQISEKEFVRVLTYLTNS